MKAPAQYTAPARTTDRRNILALIALWIAMELLVNPVGNFPLNDDWAYARSVQVLLQQGTFQLSDWTATNLFSQVFWGALFCLPGGFSFTALRFSTVFLGLVGILVTYIFLRDVDADPWISLCGALLIAFNPIYFELSNTFMNDVPSFAFLIVSLYFLHRALMREARFDFAIGIIAACIAVLTRQTGFVAPLAFGGAWLVKKGFTRNTLMKALLPTVLVGLTEFAYRQWLQVTGRMPYFFGDQIDTIFEELAKGVLHTVSNYAQITTYSLVYLGLFLFPILIVVFSQKLKGFSFRKRIRAISAILALTLAGSAILFANHKFMPFVGNILVDFGVGAFGLGSTFQPRAPKVFWGVITIIGVLGAILILELLFSAALNILNHVKNSQADDGRSTIVFALSSIFVTVIPLGALGLTWRGFYDRYLIPLLPLLLIVVAISNARAKKIVRVSSFIPLVGLLIALGGFTIAATHDFLSAYRTLWQGTHELMETSHVSPDRIEAGFEFNGWYLCKDKARTSPKKGLSFACLWWNDKADFIFSCEKINGCTEVHRYPFRTWMPPGEANILLLHKIAQH